MDSYPELFRRAMAGAAPYPYQVRLAEGDSLPGALHVPTGAGKTAAVVLSWLWRRRFHQDSDVREATPRRLVYCLPMRVLVEQTADCTREYLSRLDLLASDGSGKGVGVHVLMGGELQQEWALRPERDAVLVGTQDMLLSRALNRGYAASRFRWPVEFGLLNSDCLWVFDETQLMGVGRATSAQLEGFRRHFGTFGPTQSLWMSATLRREDLATVDFEDYLAPLRVARLKDDDRTQSRLRRRMEAPKILESTDLEVPSRKREVGAYLRRLADQIVGRHRSGTQTLVVMNTVDRAVRLYDELLERTGVPVGAGTSVDDNADGPEVLLAHSRFRGRERTRLNKLLQSFDRDKGRGRIVVATQVVEAGVDLSSRMLFTELAPWSSMVQRMGRCNRYGEHVEAEVRWIDVSENRSPPYQEERLAAARARAKELTGASVAPADLEVEPLPRPRPVLRRQDLLEFFDTEPDLSGNEVDVAPYIRQHQERDVSVFWRSLSRDQPTENLPERAELCSVPVHQLSNFVAGTGRRGWRWDHLDEQWRAVEGEELRPGQLVLLSASDGGYSRERGWSPNSEDRVPEVKEIGDTSSPEGTTEDRYTRTGRWETLAEHTNRVVSELSTLVDSVSDHAMAEGFETALLHAARFHDLGKAHPVFQDALQGKDGDAPPDRESVWGKAPDLTSYERRYFRHELASALALLGTPELLEAVPDRVRPLVPYLVAAHHGKVRLAIRALPGERLPPEDGGAGIARFARGVWEGDQLPSADLGEGYAAPSLTLSLETMELGASSDGTPSWLDRSLRLLEREDIGPFRLGYLEALLRVADWRASAAGANQGEP